MIRAVSFDATGTLFHAPRLGEIYAEVLARHGCEVAAPEATRLVRLTWDELSCRVSPASDRFASHPRGAMGFWHDFVGRLCAHLGGPPATRFLTAELFDRFGRAESWEVYPEVEKALAGLRQAGLRLAVVSNWDQRLPVLLERLGLAPHLDALVYSAEVGCEKPHPLIFEELPPLLRLPPESILHVGDSPLEDVEGARAAGFQSLLLRRGGPAEGAAELGSLADLDPAMLEAVLPYPG